MSDTRIDLLRHGEPDGVDCFRGSGVDHPLTELGWQQMETATSHTNNWDHIITSPLSRCREFAEKLAEKSGISLEVEDNFKEIGFGAWEGRTKEEVLQQDAETFKRFKEDPVRNRPAGAEPLEKFTNRVWHTLEKLAREHQGKRLLLVTHAGVLRVVTAKTLGLQLNDVYNQMKIEYAATVSCRFNDKGKAVLLLPSSL